MRIALRTRLVAMFAFVFALSTAVVLLVSYALVSDQVYGTLPAPLADPILDRLAWQYVLALLGTTLIACVLGWVSAKRLLAPIAAITATARRASEDRLNERLELRGPEDELRELADTFDAMLDRFQESIESQRRFIANASHELRSPLTAIRTEADVTLADPDASVEELRRMGERVLNGADDLDDLLAALMLLARSQRGLLNRSELDLADVTRLALGDLQRAAGAAGVTVEAALDPAPVVGDQALLRRLVANLVDNAVRYNREGGQVRVEVTTRAGAGDGRIGRGRTTAVVRVTNTGQRVPAEDVDRLRQPFERLGRHGAGGSGLGLSIVQAVAEAHGGTVGLQALDAGGLEVVVTIPVAAGAAAARPAVHAEPGATAATRAARQD